MPRTAIIISVAAVLLLPIILLTLMSLFARRPQHLGVTDGRLAACPASPNCVGSQEADTAHHVEPLEFAGSAAAAVAQLKTIIASFPRA